MTSNPFFLISIMVSSLIAFATIAMMVEVSLHLFRVNKGRVRSVCRMLPFLSLLIDLLFNSFSIGYVFNPFNCSSCVQKIVLTLFFPELKNYLYSNEISLLNYLGSESSHLIFSALFIMFFVITLLFVARKLFEGILRTRELNCLIHTADICDRPIENELLASTLQNSRVKIYACTTVSIPMVTYSRIIFMPRNFIKQFSQEEYETVVAHELEHVLWKDPFTRLFSQLISAIFWWVPTQLWQNSLELDQEIACDRSIEKYGFKRKALASALYKVATAAKEARVEAFCYLSNDSHPLIQRVQTMLEQGSTQKLAWSKLAWLTLGLTILITCSIRM